MSYVKRLKKEFADLENNPPAQFAFDMNYKDILKLEGTIFNLRETPYEGGFFFFTLILPTDYPFKPPKIKINTKIYHPNINENGDFSVGDDICNSTWTPKLTIKDFLNYIVSIIIKPNADDPYVPEIAKIYKSQPDTFFNIAKEWTLKYAS